MAKVHYSILFMVFIFKTLLCFVVVRQGKKDIIKNVGINKCNEWKGTYYSAKKYCVCEPKNGRAKLFLSKNNGSPMCIYKNRLSCRVVAVGSKEITLSLDGNYGHIAKLLLWNTKQRSVSYGDGVIGSWFNVTKNTLKYFPMTSSSFLKAKLSTIGGNVFKLLFSKSGSKCLILKVKGRIKYPFDVRVFDTKTFTKVRRITTSTALPPVVTSKDDTKTAMIFIIIIVASIVITVAIVVTIWKITTCKKSLRKKQATTQDSKKNVERTVSPVYDTLEQQVLNNIDYESPIEPYADGTYDEPGDEVYYSSIKPRDEDYESPVNLPINGKHVRPSDDVKPSDEVYYTTINSLSEEPTNKTKSGYSSLRNLKDNQYCALSSAEEDYENPLNETDVFHNETSTPMYHELVSETGTKTNKSDSDIGTR